MRRSHSGERPGALRGNVGGNLPPFDPTAPCICQRHAGFEMRPGDRTERKDQRHQCGARRQGVGKQGDGDVAAG